jgi:hypothetical protein
MGESRKSTLLIQQKALFNLLGNKINTNMPNSSTLVASNISEEEMVNVNLVTNYAFNNANLHFDKIEVYLEGDLEPVNVYGFYDILNEQIQLQDTISFINKENIYQPFKNGFQNGITINELCDSLSELCAYSTDTRGSVKTYTMTFGNQDEGFVEA